MELRPLSLMILLIAGIHFGHAEEKPKAVVNLYPDKHEPTTARCEIRPEGDWTYSWFSNGSTNAFTTDKEFSITAGVSHMSSNVTCRGERKSHGLMSEISDAVTLNLPFQTASYKAVLTVQPDPSQISRGKTVTLTCDVPGENWKYRFNCGDKAHDSEVKEFDITVESTQKCRCSGWRQSSDPSEWSNEVTLTVSDKPKVIIKPQSSVFTGDTVTLSCEGGRPTGQMIIWYIDFNRTGAGNETKTLTNVKISDGGMYKCVVKGGRQGPAVQLTVTERPKASLRVQPDGGVFRGQMVTFTCHIPDSDVTRWSYSWNKDDSVIQDSESQEYRISSVHESHAGLYSCRGRETGGLRHTNTSDQHTLTVSDPPADHTWLIALSAGLSALVLLCFILLLLWCCKRKKDVISLSPSADHQQHNISQTPEEKRKKQTLRSDSVNDSSDVTYAQIEMKTNVETKKKNKDDKENSRETPDTVYCKLKI